jgi:hypothetical protein
MYRAIQNGSFASETRGAAARRGKSLPDGRERSGGSQHPQSEQAKGLTEHDEQGSGDAMLQRAGAGHLSERPNQHLARLGAIGRPDDSIPLHPLNHPRRVVVANPGARGGRTSTPVAFLQDAEGNAMGNAPNGSYQVQVFDGNGIALSNPFTVEIVDAPGVPDVM